MTPRFQADREVAFLGRMIVRAVEEEMPQEVRFLRGYDDAYQRIDAEFDILQRDIALLIRLIHGNGGHLSKTKRAGFDRLPDAVIARLEEIVGQAFEIQSR